MLQEMIGFAGCAIAIGLIIGAIAFLFVLLLILAGTGGGY